MMVDQDKIALARHYIDKVEVDSNFIQVKEFIDYAEKFISEVESGHIMLED